MDHSLPPARVTLEQLTAERVELYHAVPPPGEKILTSVMPKNIHDSVPTEEEVKWSVWRLRGHRSVGHSRMRAKHLPEWLQ